MTAKNTGTSIIGQGADLHLPKGTFFPLCFRGVVASHRLLSIVTPADQICMRRLPFYNQPKHREGPPRDATR